MLTQKCTDSQGISEQTEQELFFESIKESKARIEKARDYCQNIRKGLEDVRRELLEFYDSETWKDLGYSRWSQCMASEFSETRQTIWRKFKAALIERETIPEILLHRATSFLKLDLNYWLILGKLDSPEDRIKALQQAHTIACNKVYRGKAAHRTGKMNSKILSRVVDQILGIMPITEAPQKPDYEARLQKIADRKGLSVEEILEKMEDE